MTDTDRIDQLEQRSSDQGTAWLRAAATHAGWHDPAAAAKLVDPASVTNAAAASKVVADLTRDQPYLARPSISDEQRWGSELLARMDAQTGRR